MMGGKGSDGSSPINSMGQCYLIQHVLCLHDGRTVDEII